MGWVVMKTQEDWPEHLRLSLIMHGEGGGWGGAMSSIGVISFMLYS